MISSSKEPVYLRALELSDLAQTFKWHNDPKLYETLVAPFRPTNRSAEEDWLRKAMSWSPSALNFAICSVERDAHMGNIYLRDIDPISRRGELHILIGEEGERGKGYGTAAVRLLANYSFRDIGLKRLWLQVLADNAVAIRVYEKCGFAVEGRLKNHVFKNGAYKDVLVMGICSHEFKQGQ